MQTQEQTVQWLPVNIPAFKDLYEVSDQGHVRNIATQEEVEEWEVHGYTAITLLNGKEEHSYFMNETVLFTFKPEGAPKGYSVEPLVVSDSNTGLVTYIRGQKATKAKSKKKTFNQL